MDKNELFVSRNKSTPKTNVLDMPTKIDDKSAINLTNYENETLRNTHLLRNMERYKILVKI